MESQQNCEVCGLPLVGGKDTVSLTCRFCGKLFTSQTDCPEGHHCCDVCRKMEVLEVLEQVIATTTSSSPLEILERVMAHPALAMHGANHHYIVPAVIVAAASHTGYPVPVEAIQQAVQRGSQVPGGWCAFCGACGAAVGVGIAVSALVMATPLNGKKRSLAMEATSFALSRMLDDAPRCCKKASRIAMEVAVEFCKEKLGINMDSGRPVTCCYSSRNRECVRAACPYYPSHQTG
ncbi:MAG: DUF5714 domain-containing protein [Chloroflexota bacterium]